MSGKTELVSGVEMGGGAEKITEKQWYIADLELEIYMLSEEEAYKVAEFIDALYTE